MSNFTTPTQVSKFTFKIYSSHFKKNKEAISLRVLKNDSDSDQDCNLHVKDEDEEVAVEDKQSEVVPSLPSLSTKEKVRRACEVVQLSKIAKTAKLTLCFVIMGM